MKQVIQRVACITVGITLSVLLLPNSMANDRAQDARWSQENTSSPHDYYMTLKKEAEAAYKINRKECKTKACLKEARKTYDQDLIDAKRKSDELKK